MAAPTTWALLVHELRAAHRTRSLLTAVVLGAVLVVMAAILGATLDHRVSGGASVAYQGTDVVVRSQSGGGLGAGAGDADSLRATGSAAGIGPEAVATIAALPGVADADALTRARAGLWVSGRVDPTVVESLPAQQFRWQHLANGRYPETGTEVAVSTETLRRHNLRLGDVVTMATDPAGDGAFTITGAVDTRGALDYESTDYAIVTPALAQAFAGTDGANEVRIALEPGADPGAVIDEINASAPVGWPENTAVLSSATEDLYRIGFGVLTTLIDGFALVTAVVALTVLGTVVWASLPGRRRHLALMRLIGATRGQLIAVLLLEAAVIAGVGAIVAVPLGIGLTAAALPALGAVPGVPSIPWSQVVLPVPALVAVPIVAILGAMLATVAPALRAARVAPADALRSAAVGEPVRPLAGATRLAVLAATLVAAAITAAVAGPIPTLVTAALFFAALVVSVPDLCRLGAGLVARLGRGRSPLTDIGAAEVRAYPGRTAATALAAMLASTVLALSWVGLDSIGATTAARSNADPGPELMVGAYPAEFALDPTVTQALSQIDGIDAVLPVPVGPVQLTADAPDRSGRRLATRLVVAGAEGFADITHGRFPLSGYAPDTVVLPADGAGPFQDGSTVLATGPTGERALTVRTVADLPVPGLIDPAVMEAIGQRSAPTAAWLALAPGVDRTAVLGSAGAVATVAGDLPVTGTVVTDAKVDALVHTARRIATAMLAVAVLIAIVGAVVTVTASLRDRAGEFAVLRLLGMEGAQLRRLVGAETLGVGAAGVVIGLVAGALLGTFATVALAGVLGVTTHVAIPVVALVALGAATVVALRVAVTGPIDAVSLVPPAAALRSADLGGTR